MTINNYLNVLIVNFLKIIVQKHQKPLKFFEQFSKYDPNPILEKKNCYFLKIFLLRLNNWSDVWNEFRNWLHIILVYSVCGRVQYSFEWLKVESEVSLSSTRIKFTTHSAIFKKMWILYLSLYHLDNYRTSCASFASKRGEHSCLKYWIISSFFSLEGW